MYRPSGEMSAAVRVNEMYRGRIVRLIRRLYAALSHHRVRVTHAELRHDEYARSRLVRLYRRGRACAAAAYDKNVNVVIGCVKLYLFARYPAVRL